MKLKKLLLSTCVLCSLSTVSFSVTVSNNELRAYAVDQAALISGVQDIAKRHGASEYQIYRNAFLQNTEEYANSPKLHNGDAKRILHTIITIATKHYLTGFNTSNDRIGFYTNYLYSIARAVNQLSNAEYTQLQALIDYEITRFNRVSLAKQQLQTLKGVIADAKTTLDNISRKGEPRQRLTTYQEFREKMIAIVAQEEVERKYAAGARASLLSERDDESSSQKLGAAFDSTQHVSRHEVDRLERELAALRRQSTAGGNVGIVRTGQINSQEIENLLAIENPEDFKREVLTLGNEEAIYSTKAIYAVRTANREALRMDNFLSAILKPNAGKYADNLESITTENEILYEKLVKLTDTMITAEQTKKYVKGLKDAINMRKGLYQSPGRSLVDKEKDAAFIGLISNTLSALAENEEGTGILNRKFGKNSGIKLGLTQLTEEEKLAPITSFLDNPENQIIFEEIKRKVSSGDEMPYVAHFAAIDPHYFYPSQTHYQNLLNSFNDRYREYFKFVNEDTLKAILYNIYSLYKKNIKDTKLADMYINKITTLLINSSSYNKPVPHAARNNFPEPPRMPATAKSDAEIAEAERLHRLKELNGGSGTTSADKFSGSSLPSPLPKSGTSPSASNPTLVSGGTATLKPAATASGDKATTPPSIGALLGASSSGKANKMALRMQLKAKLNDSGAPESNVDAVDKMEIPELQRRLAE